MENYVKSGSAQIWTDISGTAHPRYAILCNGGPGFGDYLGPVADMIADGVNVIRFEQRGCGRSERDGRYDIKTALADMEAIRAYYGADTWVVGGHSWGAGLALFYALAHPEQAEALLYLCGTGLQMDRYWLKTAQANMRKYGEAKPEMPYDLNPEVNRQGFESFHDYLHQPGLFHDIARLKIPALFLAGEQDIRPPWPAQQLQVLMPSAVWVSIPGATHYPWLQREEEMKRQLREFLQLPL